MKSVCVLGKVQSWYDINKTHWDTFAVFREEFLERFWTCERRENWYKEITSNQFDPSRGISGLLGTKKYRAVAETAAFAG